jgi:hypothetical protein
MTVLGIGQDGSPEGVRSLQRIWIPGLLSRARGLARERSPVNHVLAPHCAMGAKELVAERGHVPGDGTATRVAATFPRP